MFFFFFPFWNNELFFLHVSALCPPTCTPHPTTISHTLTPWLASSGSRSDRPSAGLGAMEPGVSARESPVGLGGREGPEQAPPLHVSGLIPTDED